MDKQRKKQLAADYAQAFRPVGVYQIRNVNNGKVLVCASVDLAGARNRFDFYKQMNMNAIPELRHDWQRHGADSFVFEELDRLKPPEDAGGGPNDKERREEAEALLALWLEKLQPYGDNGYNKRERS